jgi:hypothetical protein
MSANVVPLFPAPTVTTDSLSAARGIALGILLSSVMWVSLIVVVVVL